MLLPGAHGLLLLLHCIKLCLQRERSDHLLRLHQSEAVKSIENETAADEGEVGDGLIKMPREGGGVG